MSRCACYGFILCLLIGCNNTLTGYAFSARGVYRAPLSGAVITVTATGRVPAGEDVCDTCTGTVAIAPVPGGNGVSVQLDFGQPGQVVYTVAGATPQTVPWDFRTAAGSLEAILQAASYPAPDAAEVAEAVDAIAGVFAGPKAVKLKGQTRHLEVVAATASRP
jgi:hypothetical protein